jgi:adenosylcobinamide kinase/adenosylcobinamide-phosphate guanylyltransferase
MKVTMLGTGAADGWPTPMCGCASCSTLRARGEVRGQTAALLDDRILLDCGPETPRAAERFGAPLSDVDLLLFTHAHPDHCHPQVLLWRRWAGVRRPLTVAGPSDALAACRDWVGPDDPVRFVVLAAGDTLRHDGWTIRAVPATHTPGAVLYDVEDPDGTRLLYATDTAPLGTDALTLTEGRNYDAVLLEETWGDRAEHGTDHHDLSTFPTTIAALRRRGALTPATRIRAIHLGHRNPPEPELGRRLAAWGADAPVDGETFTIGRSTMTNQTTSPAYAARGIGPVVAQRTLVIGGARSGKSREAERLLAAHPCVTYVATAPSRPDDAEWAARVRQHQDRRPAAWRTVETDDPIPVLDAAGPDEAVLIDCLALWTTRLLDAADAWNPDVDPAIVTARIDQSVEALVATLQDARSRVVIVTNEVGAGVVPATASGRLFRDTLGRVNLCVAAACDEVLEVMAGRVRAW